MNDDIRAYGTRIHERPEFLMTLAKLFPAAKKVEQFWETKAESYKIDFYATDYNESNKSEFHRLYL